MTKLSYFNSKNFLYGVTLFAAVLSAPVAAAESPKDKMNELMTSFPWVGLVAKEVEYGPITISKLNIEGAGRLVFCKPGEKINGSLRYKIDADKLDSWNFHHIIVGLRKQDAQSCITHSFGVWDKKGKATFSFTVPMEKGVYEVCFDYHNAALCSDAVKEWHNNPPSHKTTIGVVVVE